MIGHCLNMISYFAAADSSYLFFKSNSSDCVASKAGV